MLEAVLRKAIWLSRCKAIRLSQMAFCYGSVKERRFEQRPVGDVIRIERCNPFYIVSVRALVQQVGRRNISGAAPAAFPLRL